MTRPCRRKNTVSVIHVFSVILSEAPALRFP